jgi:hypothetical protein
MRQVYFFIRNKKKIKKQCDNIENNISDFKVIYPKKFYQLFFYLLFNPPANNEGRIIHYHKKKWRYRALLTLLGVFNNKNKIIFTMHSLRDEYEKLSWTEKLYLKFSLRYVSYVIVTNEVIKNKVISWGGIDSKVSIIPAYLPPNKDKKDFEKIPDHVWEFIDRYEIIIQQMLQEFLSTMIRIFMVLICALNYVRN